MKHIEIFCMCMLLQLHIICYLLVFIVFFNYIFLCAMLYILLGALK